MFPLKKLEQLSPRTRARKIARILQGIEVDLLHSGESDAPYLAGLLRLLRDDPHAGPQASSLASLLSSRPDARALLRGVNTLRNDILASMGAEPAEWDLLCPDTGALDRAAGRRYPIAAFLEDVRSPFNVGSMIRTAEAFGMERVYLSSRTPLPTHPRARKTARGAEKALRWEIRELSGIPGPGIFALELGGASIDEFDFPLRGTVLVGSEELGLSPEALSLADSDLGRVTIPMAGAKRSLNVSVAFGILLCRWQYAISRGIREDPAQGLARCTARRARGLAFKSPGSAPISRA
jgi:TrmH family RNA methyltransferase